MRDDSYKFLEALMAAPSPSGYEEPAQAVVYDYMETSCDRVTSDVHGNVVGVLNESAPMRVMLAGHADQIGFIVTNITKEGFIQFEAIGGIDAGVVPSLRVIVHGPKGPVQGVVGKKAIHVLEPEKRNIVEPLDKLWIDIGAANKKKAEALVSIGDCVTFDAPMVRLAGDTAASSGFDDKVGAFVVAETMRLLKGKKLKVAVFGVSTVQEEIGLRGARTSCFGIDPHAGIAVDVEHATDYPGANKALGGEVKVGGGPTITRGANVNPVLGARIVAAATKRKMPIQMVGEGRATGTDANSIQISRAGVAAGLIGVATRYVHTTVEVLSLADLEAAAELLAATLLDLPADVDFRPLEAHRRRGK
jgi:tetrahedral aminopeptidase